MFMVGQLIESSSKCSIGNSLIVAHLISAKVSSVRFLFLLYNKALILWFALETLYHFRYHI